VVGRRGLAGIHGGGQQRQAFPLEAVPAGGPGAAGLPGMGGRRRYHGRRAR
jgi:hypothetical protein